jgi:hypothetical protein
MMVPSTVPLDLQNGNVLVGIQATFLEREVALKMGARAEAAHSDFLALQLLERSDRRRGDVNVVEAVGDHRRNAHVGTMKFREHRLGALRERHIECSGDERLVEQRTAVHIHHFQVDPVFAKYA